MMDETKMKMELMTLHPLVKGTAKADNKKKEEERKKGTPQAYLCIDFE